MSDLINIIKIPDKAALVSRFSETHFNSLTTIVVENGYAAVFYLNGKVLDVLSEGEYTLEHKNIPAVYETLGRAEGDMTEFDLGVCFVNLASSFDFEWESEDGRKGTCSFNVSDPEALVSELIRYTGLEHTAAIAYLKYQLENNKEIEKLGVKAEITVLFTPEPEDFAVADETVPEEKEETKNSAVQENKTEKPEKQKTKKSYLRVIAAASITVGVLICIAVAIFLRPQDIVSDDMPQTVVDTSIADPSDFDAKIKPTDIADAKAQDYVIFGNYEQDNNLDNGMEPLAWKVLEANDDSLLLITNKAIDVVPYNVTDASVEWRDCSLRKWLAGDFYNTAFSTDEQEKVLVTTNKNALETNYNLENGNNTEDKVYLFSISEVTSYFSGSELFRRARATDYAIAKGAYVDEYADNCCRWWLRSPGDMPNTAAFVENDGYVGNYGDGVSNPIMCVRPVIRIKR